MAMETVNCNLCGSNNHRLVYTIPDTRYFGDEWFNVVECMECGLGFVNPRPSFSEMPRYYPATYYDYFEEERHDHPRRYAAESKFIESIASPEHRSLLDIGCANGGFPRTMQRLGWKVEGVEVSSNAKPISDFKVYRQEFKDIPISKPRYDVVTAWAVLEHVHDPMAYFKKAGGLLKSDGIFVFLVTNFESISSRYLFLEDVPRHLYFFTENIVKKYLEVSGFELIKKDYSDKVYSMRPVNWLRHYLYRYGKKQTLQWKDVKFARENRLGGKEAQHRLRERLKFLASHPLFMVDRALLPIYEKYQMISGTYGIVTYVGRKR
jgi:SAM-dependent methyltransferase